MPKLESAMVQCSARSDTKQTSGGRRHENAVVTCLFGNRWNHRNPSPRQGISKLQVSTTANFTILRPSPGTLFTSHNISMIVI